MTRTFSLIILVNQNQDVLGTTICIKDAGITNDKTMTTRPQRSAQLSAASSHIALFSAKQELNKLSVRVGLYKRSPRRFLLR